MFLLTLMINDYYITRQEMLLEDVTSTSELVHWHTLGKGVYIVDTKIPKDTIALSFCQLALKFVI